MKEIEKAYLAGLIDGEGCLTILKSSKKYKTKIYIRYAPRIVISNTSLKLLEYVRDMIRVGEIYERVHIFPNAKLQHALHICRKSDVLNISKQILPYLVEKKKQAEILIEACSENNAEAFYSAIHFLNKKGEN